MNQFGREVPHRRAIEEIQHGAVGKNQSAGAFEFQVLVLRNDDIQRRNFAVNFSGGMQGLQSGEKLLGQNNAIAPCHLRPAQDHLAQRFAGDNFLKAVHADVRVQSSAKDRDEIGMNDCARGLPALDHEIAKRFGGAQFRDEDLDDERRSRSRSLIALVIRAAPGRFLNGIAGDRLSRQIIHLCASAAYIAAGSPRQDAASNSFI